MAGIVVVDDAGGGDAGDGWSSASSLERGLTGDFAVGLVVVAVAAVRRHYAGNGAGQRWGWAAVVDVGGSLRLGLSSLDGVGGAGCRCWGCWCRRRQGVGDGDWERWWWRASTLKTVMVSY